MTQQAAPAANTAAAPTTPQQGNTFEQRLAAVNEEIRTEALQPKPPPADGILPPGETPATPATDDAAAKARAERKARLDAYAAKEAETLARKAGQAAQDKLARELAESNRMREALEQRARDHVDISQLDEAKFFDIAKRAKVDPNKLGAFIREQMTNPEQAAAQAARQHLDPELASVKSELAQAKEQITQFLQMQQQRDAEQQRQQMTQQFLGSVAQATDRAPLAANFLAKSGADEFLKIANMAGSGLPAGAGADALLDAVENFLDGDGRAYAQQLAEMYGLIQPATSTGTPTTPKSAAAKATPKTVSNALAQERASVVQEEGWASLPYEERLARLKAG